jgi:ribosome maturation factor RimP
MIDKEHIHKVIGEVIGESGFFLVEVHVTKGNLVQVFLDHMNGITVDDCATFSRKIEEKLNREEEDFELQVSSPGLGQPLKVIRQYHKAVGQLMNLILKDDSIIRGTLEAIESAEPGTDPALIIRLSGSKKKAAPADPVRIAIGQIKTAKIEIDFNKV